MIATAPVIGARKSSKSAGRSGTKFFT